ncbi:hypothetical protein A8139_03245 [Marinomonas primoryensis]|uniref:Uncharacterized protein n=1 Tax=Marinomonas primoryensis TaxID=178399 RepID=A0A2Z4PQ22_9GAMM|nr:hypothetical protein A8139_03245 [Marinomonas primoryensis]
MEVERKLKVILEGLAFYDLKDGVYCIRYYYGINNAPKWFIFTVVCSKVLFRKFQWTLFS